jgi:hypothetical protein
MNEKTFRYLLSCAIAGAISFFSATIATGFEFTLQSFYLAFAAASLVALLKLQNFLSEDQGKTVDSILTFF